MAPTKPRSRVSRRQRRTASTHRNKWTTAQREFLVVIHSEFNFTMKQTAEIFNHVHADDLSACGIPNGLKPHVINAQYNESKKQRAKSSVWDAICRQPATTVEKGRWQQIKTSIEDATAILSLHQSSFATATARHNKALREVTARVRETEVGGVSITESRNADGSYMFRKRTSRKETSMSIKSSLTYIDNNDGPGRSDGDSDDPDADYLPEYQRKRQRQVVAVNPSVRTPQHISCGAKRRCVTSSSRIEQATITLPRLNGGPIECTPEQYAIAQLPPNPVRAKEAHPSQQRLLYRYWDPADKHAFNSPTSFRAGVNSLSDIWPLPPPPCEELDWNALLSHLNRDPISSNFISTSSNLSWIIRQAYKKIESIKKKTEHEPEIYISVINRDALPSKAVYWVPPYHRELRKKRGYQGSFEYLVWRNIPKSAIVHSFTIKALVTLSDRHPGLAGMLQLQTVLSGPGDFQTDLQTKMRAAGTTIETPVVFALASLARFIGLNTTTSADQLSNFVSDIVKGCGFKLSKLKRIEWTSAADQFAYWFFKEPASMQEQQKIRHAFLDGVRWACGEFNCKLKDVATRQKMHRKATKIGLEDPFAIIVDAMNETKQQLCLFEKKQQKLVGGTGRVATGLLSPVTSEEDEDEEIKDVEPIDKDGSDEDLSDVEDWRM